MRTPSRSLPEIPISPHCDHGPGDEAVAIAHYLGAHRRKPNWPVGPDAGLTISGNEGARCHDFGVALGEDARAHAVHHSAVDNLHPGLPPDQGPVRTELLEPALLAAHAGDGEADELHEDVLIPEMVITGYPGTAPRITVSSGPAPLRTLGLSMCRFLCPFLRTEIQGDAPGGGIDVLLYGPPPGPSPPDPGSQDEGDGKERPKDPHSHHMRGF